MFMHNFIKIFKTFQEIGPVSIFFLEFEPRQRLGQSQTTFDNLLGYILSTSTCMQGVIKIVHSVRPFSLFQNLDSAQPRPMLNFILQPFWLDLAIPLSRSSNGYAKFYQNISKGSMNRASFTFFRI